jgi:hypothetical protein
MAAHSHGRPYSPYSSLCLAVSEASLAETEPFSPAIRLLWPVFVVLGNSRLRNDWIKGAFRDEQRLWKSGP